MNAHIQRLQNHIEPLRQQITHHQVYASIQSLEDLQIFMEYHIYAVWDFMSLLKSLQNLLTCTSVPWVPKGSGQTRYLINEIVLGEESDLDMEGNRTSHFELYLSAMQQAGASTASIGTFLLELGKTRDLPAAFHLAKTPQAAREFVSSTFDLIKSGHQHELAAVFTFGREDLIPDMFHQIVNDLHERFPESVATLNITWKGI